MAQSLTEGTGAMKGAVDHPDRQHRAAAGRTVPDVTNQGLTFDQAAQILQQAGFTVGRTCSTSRAARCATRTRPPGTMVPQGTQVQLWLGP